MANKTLIEIMQILSVEKPSEIIVNGGDLPLNGGPVPVPSTVGTKGYAPLSDPNLAGSYNATNKLETAIVFLNREEYDLLIRAGASRSWNLHSGCGCG